MAPSFGRVYKDEYRQAGNGPVEGFSSWIHNKSSVSDMLQQIGGKNGATTVYVLQDS